MKRKNILSILLAICMVTAWTKPVLNIWATSAEEKKQQAQQDMQDAQNQVDDITNQQQQVENDLANAEAQLASLLAAQEALQEDINETQAAIEQTRIELEAAKQKEQDEYEAMCQRIRYTYENSASESLWTAILEADGFVDMLNRIEYAAQVYQYDRDMLEQYKRTVQEVKDREQELDEEMNELLGQQESYLGQQAEIETLIASLEGAAAQYAEQLAAAQAKVEEYSQVIAEQDKIILQKQQEEEAARRAAEQAAQNNNNDTSSDTSGDNSGDTTDNSSDSSGSTSGSSVVSYAKQFVGNPYVWGGNSLTNGCDCSGFVKLIYEHFGYTMPRYSLSFANVGTEVSMENIQPGDIVVYDKVNGIGHVAIYAGDGKIVEAQSSNAGITCNRSVSCRTIIAIRRVL